MGVRQATEHMRAERGPEERSRKTQGTEETTRGLGQANDNQLTQGRNRESDSSRLRQTSQIKRKTIRLTRTSRTKLDINFTFVD